ncbi:hypothetical protein, partial [Allofranklinella schreckenbergeri]|uniref:hypothetical protein n=1 Tax=Allofranklinella schreckenbergeri TaxID=1076744 RepID=UPI001EEDD4D8
HPAQKTFNAEQQTKLPTNSRKPQKSFRSSEAVNYNTTSANHKKNFGEFLASLHGACPLNRSDA